MIRRHGVLILLLLLSVGCAAKRSGPMVADSAPSAGPGRGRVVIRSASLELRAKNLEHLKSEVDRFVQGIEGWVESWSLTDNRRLRMTLRVPEARLEQSMDRIAALGKLVSRSLQSRDVTEQVIDLDARLNNLKALRDRLRSYLDRTSDLKEILEVERELTRVQTEIESIEAKLEILRSQAAMSEVELTVRRRRFS